MAYSPYDTPPRWQSPFATEGSPWMASVVQPPAEPEPAPVSFPYPTQPTQPTVPNLSDYARPSAENRGISPAQIAGMASTVGGWGSRLLDAGMAGDAFGALGGAASLMSGLQGGNPFSAAGGAARMGSSLLNLTDYAPYANALSLAGGPLSMGSGLYNLSQGDVSGIPSIVSGAGALTSGLATGGMFSGGAAGANLGAAGIGAVDLGMAPALAGLGAGLSTVGGIAALGPVFHSLFRRGGIFSTAKWQNPSPGRSFAAGRAGDTALGGAIGTASSISDLTDVLNTQFAPHGEVQLGSSGFGWGGDWDDPASPEWQEKLQALRDPAQVNAGLPWVGDFVRNLWAQGPGMTGNVPFNPQRTYDLQQKLVDALPDIEAYQALKADLGTGGTRDQQIEALKALPAEGPEREQATRAILPLLIPGRMGDELPVIDWLAGKTGGVTHANRLQKMLDEEQTKISQSYTPAGWY